MVQTQAEMPLRKGHTQNKSDVNKITESLISTWVINGAMKQRRKEVVSWKWDKVGSSLEPITSYTGRHWFRLSSFLTNESDFLHLSKWRLRNVRIEDLI